MSASNRTFLTVKNTFVHVEVEEDSGSSDGSPGGTPKKRSGRPQRAYSDSEIDSRSNSCTSESWTSRSRCGEEGETPAACPDGYLEFITFPSGDTPTSCGSPSAPHPEKYNKDGWNEAWTMAGASFQQEDEARKPVREAADLRRKSRPSKSKRAQAKQQIEKLKSEGHIGNDLGVLRQAVEHVSGKTSNKEAFIIKKIMALNPHQGESQADGRRSSTNPASANSSTPTSSSTSMRLNTAAEAFVPGLVYSKLSL